MKPIKRHVARLAVAFAAILSCATLWAQTGNSAYNFLEIPTSSHVFGLGGTNVAIIDDDVMLADSNPALIGPELGKQVGLSYMHYFGSSNFAAAKYGMGAGERGAWAAGIRYLDYGSFTSYQPDGTPIGSFSVQDIVFDGTYSHDFTDRLRGGIQMKLIYSHYEQYSAFAMAADIGLNYYNPDKDMSLSVVLKNMGGQLKRFEEKYDRLPFDIQLGYQQSLGHSPFSLAITAWNLTKWDLPTYTHSDDGTTEKKSNFIKNFFRHLIFGLQYQPSYNFYIDLAYNYKTRSDMANYQRNFLSGFSLGAGLKVHSFGIGVAYAMPHKSASSIMLNLSCDLAELL